MQRHSEHTWDNNAKAIVEAVVAEADAIDAELVVVAGDERAVQLVRDHLPERFADRVVTDPFQAADEDDEAAVFALAVTLVRDQAAAEVVELLQRFAEQRGQGDAADGTDAVFDALRRSAVEVLLVAEDVERRRVLRPGQSGHGRHRRIHPAPARDRAGRRRSSQRRRRPGRARHRCSVWWSARPMGPTPRRGRSGHCCGSDAATVRGMSSLYPYADRFPVNRTLPDEGRSRESILDELRALGHRRGPGVGDGQVLGLDVLRRPRPLRLHERGVRPVRPHEHPPARHVPQRNPVRGRGHRHGARPHARRRRGRAGPRHRRHGHLRRLRLDHARDARLPRPRPLRSRAARHHQPEHRQARDQPPGLRQGLPPVRHRDPQRGRRPGDHDRSGRGHGRPHRREHRRPRRLGLQLRLRHHRPHPGAVRPRRRAGGRPPRRRLPRRLHPPLRPGARPYRARSPPSTSASPASPPSRPTPTSTATGSRARRRCCSATRSCATASTSSAPTGPAASTARRAWRAPARAACSPPRGRRW